MEMIAHAFAFEDEVFFLCNRATRRRKPRPACSFIGGAGGWWRRCRRCSMIRVGRSDVLKVDADEDGVGGDDAADALRYLVATKWRTPETPRISTGLLESGSTGGALNS